MIQATVGDRVTRILAGSLRMYLTVTEVSETKIICGPWEFSRENGNEIDEDLGWDETKSGSCLMDEPK